MTRHSVLVWQRVSLLLHVVLEDSSMKTGRTICRVSASSPVSVTDEAKLLTHFNFNRRNVLKFRYLYVSRCGPNRRLNVRFEMLMSPNVATVGRFASFRQ